MNEGNTTNKTIFFYCSAIVFVLVCFNGMPQSINNSNKNNLLYISKYYNEDYDSLRKYMLFSGSGAIASVGLHIYYFHDIRDTQDEKFCGANILIHNAITDNYSVYSRPIKGEYCASCPGSTHIFMPTVYLHPFLKDYYCIDCDKKNYKNVYSIKNIGMSMKLSEILNNIPVNKKRLLNKQTIDSIFRLFIFYPNFDSRDVKFNAKLCDDTELDVNLRAMKSALWNGDKQDENYKYNSRYIDSFSYFIRKNFNKDNFYIYFNSSPFFEGTFCILITINDDIKQQSLYGDSAFYKVFDNEPMLYNVRVYSVYYFY